MVSTRLPTIERGFGNEALEAKLQKKWETPKTVHGWLSTCDHKKVGIRYLVTAFAFLILGGIEALILRIQLSRPEAEFLSPEAYNQIFSMHGISMIFLYAGPILSGFSNYLWPLLLGARDMAFPRLNALSYWIFLASGLFIYSSFLFAAAPNDGWFAYVPYALREYNPGPNMDFMALGIILLGISTTVGAINFVVTTITMRAPGMSLNRLPVLIWGTLTASVANIFVIPVVSLAFFLMWMDRQFGTDFYTIEAGGQPLLYQHLFWIFGHPWVYAIVLPAMGMVSDALPAMCRRPLVGYAPVALATVATMLIGFGVWTHHMFATGLPSISLSFFSGASLVIAVPSAVSVFAWVATIWEGKPVLKTPFLYFAGFIILFVIGGVSGFMTAAVPVDWQLTDTYFVVAHIHYVLIGINVFPVLGGFYYWLPKITGRMLDERLGQWSFWLTFTGINVAFLPMHLTGLWGMPRRIYTYGEEFGWTTLNMITTLGAFIFAVGILVFIVNFFWSLRRGAPAGPNPWNAGTIEWSTPSPPPPYNFAALPSVGSRYPLWERDLEETAGRSTLGEGYALDEDHEVLRTSSLDAHPEAILEMPHESLDPVLLTVALSGLFICLMTHAWTGAWLFGVLILAIVVHWLWPREEFGQRKADTDE